MYSEAFFILLRDSWHNLSTSYSDKKIEHVLSNELKTGRFSGLRQAYIREERDFPEIKVTNCAILNKNLSILTKNNAIQYSAREGSFTVCKNYLMSEQHLREEFHREATLAYRYRNFFEERKSKEEGRNSEQNQLQKELTYFACSTVAACANELHSSIPAAEQNNFSDATKKAASLKCANIHFKQRYNDFLSSERLKTEQANQHFFEYVSWHHTAREYVQANSHCYKDLQPF